MTPEPVVSYIVRSVHGLLKSEFSLKSGLADSERIKIKVLGASGKPEEHEVHRVLVLDPAVGTGTFLHGVIDEIFDELEQSGQRGTWNKYVAQNLLPRVFGFELQMAPYAVCHMKLGLQLEELGYKFRNAERLQVFLTNTLEAKYEYPRAIPFARWLSDEAIASKKVKEELPIMVVIGNPPYSRSSWNRSKFIEDLMLDYKVNVRESESQIQGLSNDYIKFIRFAQWRLDTTKQGILAFITGHGYLNGPQARDMRRSLLASFDSIFILNLHGSLRRDHGLNVQSDEPVFDIQQGTAIIIGVRHANRPKSDCMVSYADLVGTVDSKFSYLGKSSVFDGEWDVLSPRGPNYYFVPERSHQSLEDEYSAYLGLPEFFGTGNRATDKEKYWATGCATQQDHFAVAFSGCELKEKVDALIATKDEDAARRLFKLCSTDQWNYERAKSELAEVNVKKEAARYLYRPFDWRISLLDRNVISIPRFAVMKHLKGDKSSLALICSRVVNDSYFAHVACTRDPVDKIFLSGKTSTNAYVFPLFQTSGEGLFGKKLHSTLSELAVERLTTKLGLAYESAGNKSKGGFDAAQVMSYVYAILYCPTYRERYAEFLKADFPKIPITSDPSLFLEMSRLGSELISLHLLEADLVKEIGNRGFPKAGDDHVQNGFPHYAAPGTPEPTTGKALRNGRVYINSESGRLADGQFFDNVPPEVWDFRVGGYQVCEKWLKDRRGKELASEEIVQYQQIVNALEATIRIMAAIDACIPTWPVR